MLIEPPTRGISEGVIIHTVPLPGRHPARGPIRSPAHERGVLLASGAEPSPERLARRAVDGLVRRG